MKKVKGVALKSDIKDYTYRLVKLSSLNLGNILQNFLNEMVFISDKLSKTNLHTTL